MCAEAVAGRRRHRINQRVHAATLGWRELRIFSTYRINPKYLAAERADERLSFDDSGVRRINPRQRADVGFALPHEVWINKAKIFRAVRLATSGQRFKLR